MKLVHFTAEWCQPCKMMKPVIDDILSRRDDIEYVPVDIDKNQSTAVQYGVMGVPTFVLEEDGQEVNRVTGAMPKNDFLVKLGL